MIPNPNDCRDMDPRLMGYLCKNNLEKIVVDGFIHDIMIHDVCVPPIVTELCESYFMIPKVKPNKDAVNIITKKDKKLCDQYKNEGNIYFKNKEYSSAITKYTKALFHDPNNNIVWNNRALCHYLVNEYKLCVDDAKSAIECKPTFPKSWINLGKAYQKLNELVYTGVCYKTAYNIIFKYEKENYKNKKGLKLGFKKLYNHFMFNVLKNRKNIKHKIDRFSKKAIKSEEFMRNWMIQNYTFNGSEQAQRFSDYMDANPQYKSVAMDKQLNKWINQSRVHYMLNNDLLESKETEWGLSWSSTALIQYNKRQFNVFISDNCNGQQLCVLTTFGEPDSERILNMIYNCMVSRLSDYAPIKPVQVYISYRMRHSFDYIKNALNKLDILTIQQTKEEQEQYCKMNGTEVSGYNNIFG